ncbi:unnamed protein product [Adineta steineri]|uniref:Uncharacterized protein n=1 Tax=Adineta steineri TaxID=433720 RepID=A0A819AZX5_9BILA|nr:unnamed protein product [Adineta steineri]CAF3793374.1 unnamed protein product [Adineta steineri]
MLTPDAEHTRCTILGVNATQSEHGIVSDYVYFEAYMVMSLPTLAAAIRIYEIAELNQAKITMSCSNAGIIPTYRDHLCEILNKSLDFLFCNRNKAFS